MDLGGQLHTTASITHGKQPPVSIVLVAGSGPSEEEKIS
jgi:hypothetical protein